MKVKEAIKKGIIELKINGIEEPNTKARLIMQYVLNQPRQYVIVHDNELLQEKQQQEYFNAINKLKKHIPIQHITQQQEFMKMNFFVNRDVLIPRQDTEVLVEEVINIAKEIKAKKILDMCTGSGAIAVSLAKYIQECEITAVDISTPALKIAKKNAVINKVENKIIFVKSNIFENVKEEKYDIIVSNPPYIKKSEIKKLSMQVQKEPEIALDGGEDGLFFYKKIIKNSSKYLKYKGLLCFEIGYDQKDKVLEIIKESKEFINAYYKKDLYDNDRIIVCVNGVM